MQRLQQLQLLFVSLGPYSPGEKMSAPGKYPTVRVLKFGTKKSIYTYTKSAYTEHLRRNLFKNQQPLTIALSSAPHATRVTDWSCVAPARPSYRGERRYSRHVLKTASLPIIANSRGDFAPISTSYNRTVAFTSAVPANSCRQRKTVSASSRFAIRHIQ